jgi:UDP-GlcNAc:undecaprenyl-phosphate/decaprenyl-phosphate GlcNAc-1-phosphate transferase
MLVTILFPLLVAGALSFALTPLAIRLAHGRGWVSQPRADRWKSRPVALSGGIAIIASALMAAVAGGYATNPVAAACIGGAIVLLVMGLIDDRNGLGPRPKLLVELVVSLVVIAAGVRFAPQLPAAVSIPLTLFWIIGVTNALNLLDNMDGLAGGAAAVIAGAIGGVALAVNAPIIGGLAFCVAGAAAGFLPFNYRSARVFMGDAGSLPLGFLIAVLSLAATNAAWASQTSAPWVAVLPIVICALPLLDTTLVTVSRLRTGRRVSQGGRDHASHRLVYLGLGDTGAVLALHVLAALCGVCAVVAVTDVAVGPVVLLLAALMSAAVWVRLDSMDPYAFAIPAPEPASEAGMSVPRVDVPPAARIRAGFADASLREREDTRRDPLPRPVHSTAG